MRPVWLEWGKQIGSEVRKVIGYLGPYKSYGF